MGQPDDVPAGTAPTPVPSTTSPVTSPVTPALPDVSGAQAALADLQLQDSVVAQVLQVIDEAGRAVASGAPRWVDPEVFGGSGKGERMARHTIGAQARVHQALDMAMAALVQHQVALTTFRDEVQRVEADTADELAAVRARLGSVPS